VKEEGQWRMRYNKKLYELYKDIDLVTFIKLKRLQWASHHQGWRQYAPLKRETTIILHGSTSQKTIMNFILAAVRTLNLTYFKLVYRRNVVVVTLTTGIKFLLFTCIHLWILEIL
jgi:hypothetical protein